MEVGEEGDYVYLSLRSHHQNDSFIKMGSDESHFNASLIVRDKVTRRCPQTTTFEVMGQPKRNRACLPTLRLTARPNRLTMIRWSQIRPYECCKCQHLREGAALWTLNSYRIRWSWPQFKATSEWKAFSWTLHILIPLRWNFEPLLVNSADWTVSILLVLYKFKGGLDTIFFSGTVW